jgi:hypothetical protein
MTPQQTAHQEMRLIAAALVELGGSATKEAIADRSGLPVRTVGRRLVGSGFSITGRFRFFCRTENETWTLSSEGRKLLTN